MTGHGLAAPRRAEACQQALTGAALNPLLVDAFRERKPRHGERRSAGRLSRAIDTQRLLHSR
jgi:hypothetical protein